MTTAQLDAYLADLIAKGYMRKQTLPDGRVDHVLTTAGEQAVDQLNALDEFAIREWMHAVQRIGG